MKVKDMKSKVKRIYNDQGILVKKQCTECNRILPVDNYRRENKTKDHLRSKCRECEHKYYMKRTKYDEDLIRREATKYEANINTEVYGIIYFVYNIYSRRHYIGQTTRTYDERYPAGWLQEHVHKPKIREDLEKYGKDSFIAVKIYDIAYNKEHLNALEAHYMNKFDSINNGYNSKRNLEV